MRCEETVRAFIAIEVSDAVRRSVANVQSGLETSGAHLKWVRPTNLHLTLAFLGNTPADALPAVTAVMQKGVSGVVPFTIEFAGVGTFGRNRIPRVVWVGVHDESGSLLKIQGSLWSGLRRAGIAFDDRKPFAPHLTIARLRDRHSAGNLREEVQRRADHSFGRVDVSRTVLVESDLQTTGPIYTVIGEAALPIP